MHPPGRTTKSRGSTSCSPLIPHRSRGLREPPMKNRHPLRLSLMCAWTLLAAGCSPDLAPGAEDADSATPGTTTAALLELDLRTKGAACNGTTNDLPAFISAFKSLASAGGGTLLVPAGNCLVKTTTTNEMLTIPANVTVRGVAGASRITLEADSDRPERVRALFNIANRDITLQDLELVRNQAPELARETKRTSALIILRPSSNFTMRRVVLDGQQTEEQLAKELVAHGVMFASGGEGALHRNIRMEQCTVRNLVYGLFQASNTYTNVSGIVVNQSTFEGNFKDDLEFNAPKADMADVEVSDSTFRDNRRVGYGAGFGIGLANVQGAVIRGNSFDNYRYEPIHIEDRSSKVLVEGNTFTRSYTAVHADTTWRSHIFIINNSHDVTVRGNHFDMSANTQPIQAIYASPGGSIYPPYGLRIEQNTFVLGTHGQRFLFSEVKDVVLNDNPVYVSDMPWLSQTNGVGPAERDRSNGDRGATDGHTLSLAGVKYAKGVGVHAASEIVIHLGGQYSRFKSHIGVDDSMGSAGTVVFSVIDEQGNVLFQSGTLKGTSATQVVDVDVVDKQQLRLLVGNAGDGGTCDHGDWAGARLD
ncbi:hypothetical protein F0U60_17885 [Archangium minus]|uniref:Glycosyl hydrolase family 98 putative carbohydrate-binding module domain-containing protein n=2 Tax=Archangium minus TaxID=83450 RepID=A0ABY9WUX4_9BACT|nr:hypothetical protein F0U60_17885 [Archangium minus]